jgi:hypothetical protein
MIPREAFKAVTLTTLAAFALCIRWIARLSQRSVTIGLQCTVHRDGDCTLLLSPMSARIPLPSEQKARLFDLEGVVERNLSSFLEAGQALLTIRDERLYRAYGTWEEYCRRRFGITQCRGLELVRSAESVENLLKGPADPDNGDVPLPADLAPSMLRPLNGLESSLACACWRLASRLDKPTGHVVGQIVRVVKGAIGQAQSNGSDASKSEAKCAQKAIFLASIA